MYNDNQVSVQEALEKTDNFNDFIKAIAYDTSQFRIFRNPLADEWRAKYIRPLQARGIYNLNMFSFEQDLLYKMREKYPMIYDPNDGLSMRDMIHILYDKETAILYNEYVGSSLELWVYNRYEELKNEIQN